MNVVLPSVYWPNLTYMQQALRSEVIEIEVQEHFVKQSLRTRCEILSANGPLRLSIPVKKTEKNTRIKDVEISYQSKWQGEHWRAICSAYNNSPYFEYFKPDFETFYTEQTSSLLEFNTAQLKLLLKILRVKKEIQFTRDFDKVPIGSIDLRDLANVKSGLENQQNLPELSSKPYYQTFGTKFGFVPNLSTLDLLFNTGMNALKHLSI